MDRLQHDERVAVARLHALLELLPTALDREFTEAGLTSFEFRLLDVLAESDGSRARLSTLAARTNATLPRLSRVVTGLERKGLVARVPCEEDARATNAQLTSAGRDVWSTSRGRYDDAVRRLILGGLDSSDVQRLSDLSYAILANLDPQARREAGAHPICAADPGASADTDDAPVCAADPVVRPGADADLVSATAPR